jgi:hypothetical protein
MLAPFILYVLKEYKLTSRLVRVQFETVQI